MLAAAPSPAYVIDRRRLEANLRVLSDVRTQSGAEVLLALKGYAVWSTFDLCRRYLDGATVSSLDEARLAREELGGEVHGYAPAYAGDEVGVWAGLCDHISFNSFGQWRRFGPTARAAGCSCGLRVNPRRSEVPVPLYDPSARFSRLGVPREEFEPDALEGIEGLHVHNLCGLGADALARTVEALERGFGEFLGGLRWLNLGGGHQITRSGYDVRALVRTVRRLREAYGVEVYLEPGEAVAFDAGWLVATVLDIVRNEKDIAILDTSATAHMPDVLEMPYRPDVAGAGQPGEKAHDYILGGLSCLAGDVIGEYSFDEPLEPGRRLVFRDMAHYTVVKNTTFNGLRLPCICLIEHDGGLRVVRRFGYEDYKDRLS